MVITILRELLPDSKRCLAITISASVVIGSAGHADPLSSNNGFYPTQAQYNGQFVVANLTYPTQMPDDVFNSGPDFENGINIDNAEAYMALVKRYLLDTSFSDIINTPESWDPAEAGWYDLVWSGTSDDDPTNGREALMNTYTGQILHKTSFFEGHQPTTEWVQNHAVIYYNGASAYMLGQIWKDLYNADLSALNFPEGSVVVKAEATTPAIDEWPTVLKGAQTWRVFRPTTADQANKVVGAKPTVVEAHPLQMSVKVKDSNASGETGWVFMAFVYDASSTADTVWDRFVPLGAMWGNDPDQTSDPSGRSPGQALAETWINPDRPAFTTDTLGWGGRLAGPMDVATRQGVITTAGTFSEPAADVAASSCMSCHGAGEYPFTVNLYPSPNLSFPQNGEPFLLYEPGSEEWAAWFKNRPGGLPQSMGRGTTATDYDMAIMFALGATLNVSGAANPGLKRFRVH